MVANIHCKSHDNYSERNWHPPAACVEQATRQLRSRSRERGHVRLAWTASISLYRAIRSTQNRGLQQKTSTPAASMLHSTRETHLHIDLALIPLMGFATYKKIFLRMRTGKPRSNLGDVINERDRWDLHILEEIAQRKRSTEHGWCSRTSRLLLAIRSDPMPQVATPSRDAHVRCCNTPGIDLPDDATPLTK
jgi:hypothetical protein